MVHATGLRGCGCAWAGALFGVLCVLPAAAEARQCNAPQWTQLWPAVSPPGRWFSGMVYDSARDRMVMFGGMNSLGMRLGDTWEFNGTNWSLRSSSGPPARAGHGMAYDSARHVTVVYGGFDSADFDDTWEWDGFTWTRATPTGPGARTPAGMTFDSGRGVSVMFGGNNLGDTWEWDGAGWQLGASTGPMARIEASMAYDAAGARTVVFGGMGGGFNELGDVWSWNGAAWQQVFPALSPHARRDGALAYDSVRHKLVLFGGHYGRGGSFTVVLGDTWELEGSTWTPIGVNGPSVRGASCMAFDSTRSRMVLFGGEFSLADTWVYTNGPVGPDPTITDQPADVSAAFGADVSFTVTATGGGQLHYQWRKNGGPLSDAGRITGSRTATLSIANIITSDAGGYDVVVSNPCASVASRAATLTVGTCPADFNADGVPNSQDYFDFLTAYFAGSPAADFNHSGAVDSQDFFDYVNAFFAGCAG